MAVRSLRFLLLPAVRRQVEPREGIEPTQSATVRRRARTAQDPDRARPWNRRFYALRHAGNMLSRASRDSKLYPYADPWDGQRGPFFERSWLPDMLSGLGGVTDDYASLTDHLDRRDGPARRPSH